MATAPAAMGKADNNGVRTSATVTEVDGANLTVEFTTEDNYLTTADFTWWSDEYPAVDEQIEITYALTTPPTSSRRGATRTTHGNGFCRRCGLRAGRRSGRRRRGGAHPPRARGKATRFNGFYY